MANSAEKVRVSSLNGLVEPEATDPETGIPLDVVAIVEGHEVMRSLAYDWKVGSYWPVGDWVNWHVYDGDLVVHSDLDVDDGLVVTGHLVVHGEVGGGPLIVLGDLVATVGVAVGLSEITWFVGGRCVSPVFLQTAFENEGLIGHQTSQITLCYLQDAQSGEGLQGLGLTLGPCCDDEGLGVRDWNKPEDFDDPGKRRGFVEASAADKALLAKPLRPLWKSGEDIETLIEEVWFPELCKAVRAGKPLLSHEVDFDSLHDDVKAWWPSAPEEFLVEQASASIEQAIKVALRPWPLPSAALGAAVATIGTDPRGLAALSRRPGGDLHDAEE